MKSLYISSLRGKGKFPKEWPELSLFQGDKGDPLSAWSKLSENSGVVIHNLPNSYSRETLELRSYLKMVVPEAIGVYREIKPDVIIIGQTMAGDKIVRKIRSFRDHSTLIIRFSMFFGAETAPFINTLPPYDAGYNFDLLRDHKILHQLLTFLPFIAAVDEKNRDSIRSAIDLFNEDKRVMPIRIFSL